MAMIDPQPTTDDVLRSIKQREKEDDLRWLALLIRQGLKVIVVGIERRYGLCEDTKEKRAA